MDEFVKYQQSRTNTRSHTSKTQFRSRPKREVQVDRRETRKFNRRMASFDKSIADVKTEYEVSYPLQTGTSRTEIFTEKNRHLKETRKTKDDLVKDSSDDESDKEEEHEEFKDVDVVLKSTAELLPRRINFVKSKKDQQSEAFKSDEPFVEPTHQLFEREKLYKLLNWKQVSRIGSGLNNLGNTCFLNSSLQCLIYTPLLNNYLFSRTPVHSRNFSPIDAMYDLMKKVKSSTHPVSPVDIVRNIKGSVLILNNIFKAIGKQFRVGRQEDSHEFIINLIDKMENSILSKFKNKLDHKVKETNVIRQIFGGYFLSQIETESGYKSNTYDSFVDLSLNIQNVNSVKKGIFNFSKPEILSKDNKYKNPITEQYENAKKTTTIFRAPLVLILHLKRFSYDGKKINKFIQFEETLELKDHERVQHYQLTGVIVHLGYTRTSGHYVAYVKGPNSVWYEMDDETVHQISSRKLLTQNAYILFYSKVATDEEIKESKEKVPEEEKQPESVLFYKKETPHVAPLPVKEVVPKPLESLSKTPPNKKRKREESPRNVEKRSEGEFNLDELLSESATTTWDNATVIPSPRNLIKRKKKDDWDLMYDIGKRKKTKAKVGLEEWKKGGDEFQKAYEKKQKSK